MNDHAYDAAEHDRRIGNLLLIGTIASVDLAAGTAAVAIDQDWTTDSLPWFELRAGPTMRTWSPPQAGEQVAVLSPSGEPGAGVILRGLFSGANPPPSQSQTLTILGQWSDQALDQYDVGAHVRTIAIPAGGQCVIQVGGSTSATLADGSLTLVAGGLQLKLADGAATLTGGSIELGGSGGAAVARVGDKVNLQTGLILSGSSSVSAA